MSIQVSVNHEDKRSMVSTGLNRRSEAIRRLIEDKDSVITRTSRLLDFFAMVESEMDTEHQPLEQFYREQCTLAALFWFTLIDKEILDFTDIREVTANLLTLFNRLVRSEPQLGSLLAQSFLKLVTIVSDLTRKLEQLSDVVASDWNSVIAHVNAKAQHTRTRITNVSLYVPRIADFKRVRLLGEGGFGAVFRTVYTPANHPCVVKFVRRQKIQYLQRAVIDKMIASVINSSFLIRYYACFEVQTGFVTVMEDVHGVDLALVVDKFATFNSNEVRCISAQLVVAIEHLHIRGFIHRDIKPGNILILLNGQIKLIDYDVGKVCMGHFLRCHIKVFARQTAAEFEDGDKQGTLAYTAPEILADFRYGRACDWWSVGITMYKLLCGHTPFRARTSQQMLSLIQNGNYNFLNKITDNETRNIIAAFLKPHAFNRLGSLSYRDIRLQLYFQNCSFDGLHNACLRFETLEINNALEWFEKNEILQSGTCENSEMEMSAIEDLSASSDHEPLLTYVSLSWKCLLEKLKCNDDAPFHGSHKYLLQNTRNNLEIDYNTCVDLDTILQEALVEKIDQELMKTKVIEMTVVENSGLFWNYGFQYKTVTTCSGKEVIMVTDIKPCTSAAESDLLLGDFVVFVNEKPASETEIKAAFLLHAMTLHVFTNNTYRLFVTNLGCDALLRNTASVTISLACLNTLKAGLNAYGLYVKEIRIWDTNSEAFFHVLLVWEIDKNIKYSTKDAEIFVGDILVAVEGVPLQYCSSPTIENLLKTKAEKNIAFEVIPVSVLRQVTPFE